MYKEDDEEYKKRLERAKLLRSTMGITTSDDYSNSTPIQYDNDYLGKLNQARELRNSVGMITSNDLIEDSIINQNPMSDYDYLQNKYDMEYIRENVGNKIIDSASEIIKNPLALVRTPDELETIKQEQNNQKQESMSEDKKQELQNKINEFNNSNNQNVRNDIKSNTDINTQIKNNGIRLATQEETENAKKMSNSEIDASIEGAELNRQIKEGGADAVNAYFKTLLRNAYSGLVKKPIAGLVNVGTTIAGLGIRGTESWAKLLGFNEAGDSLNNAYNDVVDFGKYMYDEANYETNVLNQVDDGFTKGSAQVVDVISNVVGNQIIGYATGVPGVTVQGLSVGGSSAQEVLNENKDNIGQATLTGLAKGYTSYLTEKMFDANILTRGTKPSSISDKITNGVLNRISNQYGKKFAYNSIGIVGENLEELVEDNVDNLIDKLVNDKDLPSWEQWKKETGETAKITTISTIIMNLLGLGGESFENKQKDIEANKWLNEAEKIIEQENMAIHYDPRQVQSKNNMEEFYISEFNQNGDLQNVTPTLGKEIKNIQPELMISPVVVKDSNTGLYKVIDGATGVVLDNDYYNSLTEAENSYNEKVRNLSENRISDINNTINQATYVINNNVMSMITQLEDNLPDITMQYAENNKSNTSDLAENKNTDNLKNKGTSYTPAKVKSITNEFTTQTEYTKNEMADIWNNKIDNNNKNVIYDKDGKIKNYIAIEEDGDNLKISLYDNNDNIVQSETIQPQNGMFTSESINNAIEKATGVYKQNNANKTPGKSTFYDNKPNYATSNINEVEKEINKKKSYTLEQIGETWSDIQENTYDMTLNDDMYIELEENDGKLEAVLYDGSTEEIPEVNRVEIEPNSEGKYTAKAINRAIEEAATIPNENKPIKGQVDIEGNEVRSMKKGRGNENGRQRSTNNGQEISREQKGKNTSRENENAKSNELAKRKQSRGLQNYQKQQQEKLGKDFKATTVEESKQSNNEKTVSKGFKEATGLDITVFTTNKSTTDAAFYSDDNIYLKHNSLANKKSTNFKPYHELGHWLKDNNYKAWKNLYDIIDDSITKQQIESYKNVLNDKSIFNNMTEVEERDYVINEIVSDYVGNWANDIMNWSDFLPNLSKEYQQYLADITLENEVTGYNMFGTVEQQEQMNNQITEIMKDIIIDKKIEHSNDNILFSNRKDIDIGNYWQIEDSKDLFKGITSTKDLQDKAYKYILNGNTNYKTITDKVDGKNVKFARISAKEYVYGRNNKKLQGNQYQEKMRTAPSIDDLIKHADIKYHSPLTHKNKLFPNGYNNYQGKVGIDNDIFRYIVRIGKTKNNESIFYDVSLELLKQQKEADNKVLRTNNSSSQKSASINNSISQKKQNVKSSKDTVNNKSIHNNSKNTSTTKIKKSNRQDIDNINYDFPENVKDIKNTNTFLKEVIQKETNKYWTEQLKEALSSNYVDWTRKESRLKWRRSIIQQYLDYKNGADTDSNGNKLTKQQRAYFKNSKAVDQYGNLKVVYHGTGEGTFTKFNGGSWGTNYYTDNIWSARSYQVGTSTANKVYEGYVNITNPLIIDAKKRNWSEIWRSDIKDEDVIRAIDNDFKNKYETYSTTDIAIAVKATKKYDGIIFNNIYDNSNNNKKELSTVYVTFNSNQFKNIDNKNPTKSPDIRYSNRYDTDENNNYGFYSQLENVIEHKMPNTANAQQINGILNNAGIKQDELKWIGLDDYLKAHSLEKITKQQLQDYIKANQINIETVEKGTNKLAEYTEPVKQDIEDKNIVIQYILDKYGFDYEKDDLVPYKRDGLRAGTVGDFMAENLEKYIDLTDFEKYEKQEDGSYIHSYKDDDGISWTTQFTEEQFKKDMQKLEDLYDQRTEAELQLSSLEDEYGDYADELGVPKYEKYSLEGGENYKEILYTLPAIEKIDNNKYEVKNNAIANIGEYRSPHWEEKNVLAHARTKDFKDTSGNKVLYIDEIQSDLHQEGRKKGYMSKEESQNIEKNRQRKSELGDELRLLNQTYNNKLDEYLENTDVYKEWINAQNDLGTVKYELVKKIAEKNNIKDYEVYNFIDKIQSDFENNPYTIKDIDKIINQEAEDIRLALTIKGWKLTSVLKEDLRKMYKATNNLMEARENKLNNRAKLVTEFRSTEEAKNFEKRQQEISDEMQTIVTKLYGISDMFPFKKNWHEFVLRRLINNAVEQGYDEVAWSTGRQQRERYNLSKVIDLIEYEKLYYHPDNVDKGKVDLVDIAARKNGDIIFTKQIKTEELADYIGKDLATKILNSKENEGRISNLDEEIRADGHSGMYLFYDQEIPNFLNKYLKKWNSKVEEITLKDADGKEESKQMGFKITDEMRNSIKQNGQPLFSNRNDLDDTSQGYVVQDNKQKERLDLANKIKSESNTKFAKRSAKETNDNLRNAERQESYIEREIQKIEQTGNWDNSIPVTKLTDIRKTVEDYLGLGIKKGHFRQNAYAIYKGNNDVIRTKEYKDMDSILHETGHAMDLGKRLNIDKESIADELLTAINKLGGYEEETRTVRLEEGFAEVIREYSIVPEQAKQEYPQTVAVLEGLRKTDKEFNKFITKVQQQSYNYIHQNPRNRTLSNISIGEQTDKKNITKNYIKQEVMRNIYDKDWAVKSAVNELAKVNGKTTNQIKASENAYYLTRLASGKTDKVISMLSDGYIDENGNKTMPGLNGIGEILGKDPQRWNDLRTYLVAKRDLEYKAKTLKTGIRTMDSKAVIEQFKNDKQIQEASKLVYDTLNGVMQYAVNNGLISQETAEKLKQSNAFYVPMHRVLDNRGNQVGRKGAVADIIKQRTGSELDVKDVLENIIANSSNVIQQVENNNVLRALYKEGKTTGLTGTIFDVIDTPMTKIGTAQLSTWENELKKQGVNTSDLDLEKAIDIFAPNNKIDAQNLITSFIDENGKRVYLQFNDDTLFNSLMNMDKKFMSQVLKINSKMNMPLRYGATMANLGFAIPNMISDTAQAAIYSTAGFIPVIDNALGVLDILAAKSKTVRNFVNSVAPGYANRINNLYSLYQQSGATNATRMSQYRETTQNVMADVYGTKSKTLGIKEKYKPLKRLLDILTYIPEISEQSTRFRVFEKNYEQYKKKGTAETDARILAALEARDATQDFGRTGNITREINQLIPFSAARVGSAYTFAEKIKANPKKVTMRMALLTAIAMGIKAMGYDDKEIEELNQRKKDDNFVLKSGDEVVTIKKPQGILRSIINLAEYIQDLATDHIEEGKEGERLANWLNNAIMDNMPADEVTGLVPNAVAPIIENAINKDFYYNTDIVKSYDLDLPDSEQYYDYNSQLAIWLGKIFNYSPAKIDNLISGYFGGLGSSVTNAMDYTLGKAGVIPEKPEMGAEQNTIGKRFVVNVNTNSSSLDEIYNRKTELTKLKNGGKITSKEEEELEKIQSAISNISDLNKQIKEIKKSLSMSGTEKAEKIKVLQEEKTDTARKALGKSLIHAENASKIQSTQFYPNDTLKKNGYSLTLNSSQKKEFEQLANDFYTKYEKQGLYNKEKLNEIKSKAKEYAKNQMFQKYKAYLVKTK